MKKRLDKNRSNRLSLSFLMGLFFGNGLEDNDGHSGKDQQYADGKTQGKLLVEDKDANQNSGERLECTHDRGGGRPNVLGGIRQQREGENGRHNGQPYGKEPGTWRVQPFNGSASDKGDDEVEEHTVDKHVEGHFEGRHMEFASVADDDVHRVGECRHQHQHHTHGAETPCPVAPIEQRHTYKAQQYGGDNLPGDTFLEKHSHDDGSHDWIGEEQGGGDASVHVVETAVERERGGDEKNAQGAQGLELLEGDLERLFSGNQDDGNNDGGDAKTVKQHGVGRQPIAVEIQRPEGVGTVAYCRCYSGHCSPKFPILISSHLIGNYCYAAFSALLFGMQRYTKQKIFLKKRLGMTTDRNYFLLLQKVSSTKNGVRRMLFV